MSDPQVPPYAAPPVPSAPYTAPYAAPQHPQFAPFVAAPPQPPRSRTLGVVALVLALAALIVTPIIAGVSGFAVGAAYGVDALSTAAPGASNIEWGLLSPTRDLVLWGEIAFWAGTVLGIWAIAQGIVAIVTRRGRGQGIAAIVVAAVAFFVFGVVAFVAFFVGLTTTVPLGM